MKKLIILLGFVAILSTALSSCKTQGGCPAYGQVDTEQQDANV